MNEEKILELSERLLADIFIAQRCLNCQMELAQRLVNNEEIIHKEFFILAKQSFLYTGTIILCKAFEEVSSHNRPFSIMQILQWANCTIELTKQQSQQIEELENEYHNNATIEKLKNQRDKFYAHNDKIDREQLLENCSITHKEKMQLINFAERVLSFIISICSNKEYCAFRDIDHSTNELKNTLNDLHVLYSDKELLKKYVRRLLQNEQTKTRVDLDRQRRTRKNRASHSSARFNKRLRRYKHRKYAYTWR